MRSKCCRSREQEGLGSPATCSFATCLSHCCSCVGVKKQKKKKGSYSYDNRVLLLQASERSGVGSRAYLMAVLAGLLDDHPPVLRQRRRVARAHGSVGQVLYAFQLSPSDHPTWLKQISRGLPRRRRPSSRRLRLLRQRSVHSLRFDDN